MYENEVEVSWVRECSILYLIIIYKIWNLEDQCNAVWNMWIRSGLVIIKFGSQIFVGISIVCFYSVANFCPWFFIIIINFLYIHHNQ